MHQSMEREKVEYELFTIGEFSLIENKPGIVIDKKLKKSIKHLDQFSHIIIIYLSDESHFQHKISGIDHIDNQSGVIYLQDTSFRQEKVFDIKPYFPVEDRVQDAVAAEVFRESLYHNKLKNSGKGKYNLSPSGEIRKIEGDHFLYIDPASGISLHQLQDVSHLRVFWWFHRFDNNKYRIIKEVDPPYENAPRTGVLASRSPVRPNPLAMTTVKILDKDLNNNRIKVSEMDCFDRTPLIDLTPYIPEKDRIDHFFVPKWLNHWPQWFNARETDHSKNIPGPQQTPLDILSPYMSKSSNHTSPLFSFQKADETDTSGQDYISITGARQNNLKNINIKIPYRKITVVTGVSGSGKSSLVFDTLFAESQRRMMDSMSTSERSAFNQQDKPDVDAISGLPPAIAISQKSIGRNPRSTVGTITDINNYLSLLFASVGTRFCPDCGAPVTPLKEKEIYHLLSSLQAGTQLSMTPFGQNHPEFCYRIPAPKSGDNSLKPKLEQQIQMALQLGKGAINVMVNNQDQLTLQTTQMCYHCDKIMFELTPATFSFNNPESMCPVCKGLGVKMEVDINKIVTQPELSVLNGASPFWNDLQKFKENPNANWMKGEFLGLAESMKIELEKPWYQLDEEFRNQALYGSAGKEVTFSYTNKKNGRDGNITRPVEGAVNIIKRLFAENSGERAKTLADHFMSQTHCECCKGERLGSEGRMVQVAGMRFPEVIAKNIEEIQSWIESLPTLLSEVQLETATPVLHELHKRLDNYIRIGIPYLSLSRSIPSLSGGELQRIKLANQLSSGVSNILYVLDEPSAGLHPKDHEKLMDMISHLRILGNTIVIVEHNEGIMKRADYLIDIGPEAGINGGYLVVDGSPQKIMESNSSETGLYLSEKKQVEVSGSFNQSQTEWIRLNEIKRNNLKNINISIPQGAITCITGVSGSGKSSLINVLYAAMKDRAKHSNINHHDYLSLTGADDIQNIINVTQQPIGRTPRSNPATYTGLMDDIRNEFAATKEAKEKGYKNNLFSFNSKEGQCPVCKGDGRKCLEVHFMPDIWTLCPVCKGKRFNETALDITLKGKNISDILEMNVEEALDFFSGRKKISRVLSILSEIGLGYIKLGQSALTLSGGEAQRIKLAKELATNVNGQTLYLLDEPTSGLHFSDIRNLLVMLRKITDQGNTVIVVEHNLNMIKNADWIIDLGPDGGEQGGNLVVQGTPLTIMSHDKSYTGKEMSRL